MADIIINGPEGQSTINNIPAWATEATQATMAKTMIGVGNKAEKIEAVLQLMLRGYEKLREANSKGDKDMSKWLNILAKNDKTELQEGKKSTKEISEGLKELEKVQADGLAELGKLNSNTSNQNESLDKILKDLSNSSNGMLSFASIGGKTLGGLGLAINIAAKALGAFGTVILVAANFVKNEFLDVFRFFNNSLSAGTGGIVGLTHAVDNVATSANLAGMSLEEFGDFAQQNSKILRTLSARGFADLYTKSLLAQDGLLAIGMTADDAVESIMTELEYRRRFGMMVAGGGRDLQNSLVQSATDLRKFANAVGMSEADLRAQSEIQENNVDQLRLRGKTLGASEQDIINNSQYIARQLGALSMEDMINPLFEAISKGSVGLSDEMTSLGVAFPGLMDIVNDAAQEFTMTGNLNKNLGMEIATLFDTMSDVDAMNLRSLVDAGVPAADAISNLQKQIGKFSANQLKKFQEDFDESRLTMQNTFNRLGFIVNQGTASIGDFGKTVLLSGLGFTKTIDDAGNETYNFNEGIEALGDSILAVTGRIFGENNSLYETVGFFNDYIKAMFGGIQKGETQDDFEQRLDDARKLFVGKINAFAEKLGDDLNKELIAGTLGSTISKMFQNLIDGVAISIYEKTGVDMGVGDIYARRIREGRMGMNQYREYAGDFSSGDREVLSDQIFKEIIHQQGNEMKITPKMSGAVGGFTDGEGANIQRLMKGARGSNYREGFDAFMDDLNRVTDGQFGEQFEKYFTSNNKLKSGLSANDIKEADRLLDMLNQRYMEVADFNRSSLDELTTLTKLAENNGLDVQYASSELLDHMFYKSGVFGLAEGQKLKTDIDEDLRDMPYHIQDAYMKFFQQSFAEHGIDYVTSDGFANTMLNELNSGLFREGLGNLGFANTKLGFVNVKRGAHQMPFYHGNTRDRAQYGAGKDVRFADEDFASFGGEYMNSMKDNFLHFKEYNKLVEMLNKLDSRYTLDDKSQNLVDEMRILVESNKRVSDNLNNVSNAISNDNST